MGNSCEPAKCNPCQPFCGSGQSCGRFLPCLVHTARIPQRKEPKKLDFSSADEGKWNFPQTTYGGSYLYAKEPEIEKVNGKIDDGLEALKNQKELYEGMYYQSEMVNWPADQQKYSLVRRTGSGFQVDGQGGPWTFVRSQFLKLDESVEIDSDDFTETTLASFKRQRLGSPVCPGRGQGCADVPSLKIIGDIDPSDVCQGGVGDCWFLSALSALAEFDGAVAKLFQHTNWHSMPEDDANYYTISLYDLETWSEVEIEIDERLCTKPGGADLLGAQPSQDGELWVCYVEKAFAAHCGGWDKIDGGQPTHAWSILTGCRDVYIIKHTDHRGWSCSGNKNANTLEWEQLANSPHDGFQGLWPMDWPEVGGGGGMDETLDDDELFQRLLAWEENNFILAAGTISGSDKNTTDGIVDGHAYSILATVEDVAGSGIDMIQMRNPWGKGEFQRGKWIDGGAGWTEYPEIEETLNPVDADDGIFWMERDEFFRYFPKIYLCAKNMTEFINS